MNCYKIEGGAILNGTIDVHGAKNAALPILTATVLNSGKSVIHNCPNLSDIQSTIEILEILGCKVLRNGKDVFVDSSGLSLCSIPPYIMNKTRSSSVFAGALCARCKKAYISSCGGCSIGSRPIDIHLESFKKMGMEISYDGDFVVCRASNIKPCTIMLKFPSVGATQNIMLASSLTDGTITVLNAAMEPEIVNLADYLRSIGVKITGDGTSKISIKGTKNPKDGEVKVIPDRIVAATYIMSALATKGEIEIGNIIPAHISPIIAYLRQMGAEISFGKDKVYVKSKKRLNNIPFISTSPYPGFPTDAQPLMVALMSVSQGKGIMRETIFENRFAHCIRLNKMGANIEIKNRAAYVTGKDYLKGARVDSSDLRCGASLCIAALASEGTTYISNTHYIDRGYENLCESLKSIGADLERVE